MFCYAFFNAKKQDPHLIFFLSEKQKYGLLHKTGVGENQIEIVCLCTNVVLLPLIDR